MINLFGGKKHSGKKHSPKKEIEDILSEFLKKGALSLSFQVSEKGEEDLHVDIFGEDEGLLKTRDGRLLQAFQTYFLCAIKKRFPEYKGRLVTNSGDFWEEKQQKLLSLAEDLAEKAVRSGRAVFLKKALPSHERRMVHERLSADKRVKSLSDGEGFLKHIKIVPVEAGRRTEDKNPKD